MSPYITLTNSFSQLLHLLSVQKQKFDALKEVKGVEAALHAVEVNLWDLHRDRTERGQCPVHLLNIMIYFTLNRLKQSSQIFDSRT